MGIDLNQFIRQIQANNPVPAVDTSPTTKLILPNNTSPLKEVYQDQSKPATAVKYQPPSSDKNIYNEKEALAAIPRGELEDIKKTEAKLKKSKVKVVKSKRDPVNKIKIACSKCGNLDEFYEGQIIVTSDNPYVCAKCVESVYKNQVR